jgi:HD-like signal output (HDOD) protein
MSSLVQDKVNAIAKTLDDQVISTCSAPAILLQMYSMIANPNTSFSAIANNLKKDEKLSILFVKIANSPLFRTNQGSEDLQSAIGRLGIEFSCHLGMALSIRGLFQAQDKLIQLKCEELSNHTLKVAIWAIVLAKKLTQFPIDKVLLMSYLSQVGSACILKELDQRHPVPPALIIDKLIEACYGIIGEKLLLSWGFSNQESAICQSHLDFTQTVTPQPEIRDLICIANLLAYDVRNPYANLDLNQVSAFRALKIDPKANLIERYKSEFEQTKLCLMG